MAVASAHLSLINRVSLPLPMPYVVPDGELETLIATIFSEVLNLDQLVPMTSSSTSEEILCSPKS
jgi:hypothetical protein